MKNVKKIVALMLVAILVLGLAGCGKGKNKGNGAGGDNGGKRVEISYWNSGMGMDYLEALMKAFNEKQSDWYVYCNATADSNSVKATYGLEDVDTIDLYMATKVSDITYMEPLDDVLASTVKGEGKTIKEKFDASYLEYELASDNHYYTLTWGGGVLGFVYNQVLFEKAGVKELPRTTTELAMVCDKLLDAGITPLTHFRTSEGTGYWSYIQELWFAQYDGWDYYKDTFYACKDANGNSPSKDVLTAKDGRYQVLKAMEKFITPKYIQAGANSQTHIAAQTLFLNEDIGMMVSGSWMANEMKGTKKTDDFGVMKTPVISGIVDKLTTVKSDTELRNLISAIDAVTSGEEEISAYQSGDGYVVNGKQVATADWEYVATARNSCAVNYPQHSFFIPTYSDAIDGAKEFLKFFYSDEGYKIFTDTLHTSLPFNFANEELNTEKWSGFEKEMYQLTQGAVNNVNRFIMSRNDIFVNGGAHPYASYNFVEYFGSNNPSDRVSADEAWDKIIKTIDGNYNSWLLNMK